MRAHVSLAVASAAVLAVSAGSVFAGAALTLTAQYEPSNTQTLSCLVNGQFDAIDMRTFNWDRSDLPAGPGVDTTIPDLFQGYCIETSQAVSGGTPHQYLVITPEESGLDAADIVLLSRLWGSFFSQVDSGIKAAAFQAAIYEIILDTNVDLASGNFIVQVVQNNNNHTLARADVESWLSIITDVNYNGPVEALSVLKSETVQDQITRVPAPGAGMLGVIGAGLLAARRRRA